MAHFVAILPTPTSRINPPLHKKDSWGPHAPPRAVCGAHAANGAENCGMARIHLHAIPNLDPSFGLSQKAHERISPCQLRRHRDQHFQFHPLYGTCLTSAPVYATSPPVHDFCPSTSSRVRPPRPLQQPLLLRPTARAHRLCRSQRSWKIHTHEVHCRDYPSLRRPHLLSERHKSRIPPSGRNPRERPHTLAGNSVRLR